MQNQVGALIMLPSHATCQTSYKCMCNFCTTKEQAFVAEKKKLKNTQRVLDVHTTIIWEGFSQGNTTRPAENRLLVARERALCIVALWFGICSPGSDAAKSQLWHENEQQF